MFQMFENTAVRSFPHLSQNALIAVPASAIMLSISDHISFTVFRKLSLFCHSSLTAKTSPAITATAIPMGPVKAVIAAPNAAVTPLALLWLPQLYQLQQRCPEAVTSWPELSVRRADGRYSRHTRNGLLWQLGLKSPNFWTSYLILYQRLMTGSICWPMVAPVLSGFRRNSHLVWRFPLRSARNPPGRFSHGQDISCTAVESVQPGSYPGSSFEYSGCRRFLQVGLGQTMPSFFKDSVSPVT